MESLHAALSVLNGYLWGPPMLVLLFGTHLLLTVRLGLIQRYLPLAIRLSFRRSSEADGDVSHFGALTTALAATIGTGNIVGVATAVSLGGPGAVLWMWLTGVFGIATKYAEALLAVKYRIRTESGAMAGGPMYVLERGLGARWAGVLFAIFTAVAAFGIGNMVQANAVASMAAEIASDVRAAWAVGAVLTLLTALTILGGIRTIARVCEVLVPFMAAFYVLGCLLILAAGFRTLPATVGLIVRMALDPGAAAGGFVGGILAGAARYGIARGLFSNESGLGSAPIVAAAARTRNPVRQALVSSTGTFWDTVVVCAMTGLVIVNAGHWREGVEGVALARQAFARLHDIGPLVLNAGLAVFVFSTILGWSYYGEKAVEYLFGSRAVLPYRVLWVCAVMTGSVTALPLVWEFADAANALMAIPNLASLLLLNGVVVAETRRYLWSGRIEDAQDG